MNNKNPLPLAFWGQIQNVAKQNQCQPCTDSIEAGSWWRRMDPRWELVLGHYENYSNSHENEAHTFSLETGTLLLRDGVGWRLEREVLQAELASWRATELAGDLCAQLKFFPGIVAERLASSLRHRTAWPLQSCGLWSGRYFCVDQLAQGQFQGNSRQPTDWQPAEAEPRLVILAL